MQRFIIFFSLIILLTPFAWSADIPSDGYGDYLYQNNRKKGQTSTQHRRHKKDVSQEPEDEEALHPQKKRQKTDTLSAISKVPPLNSARPVTREDLKGFSFRKKKPSTEEIIENKITPTEENSTTLITVNKETHESKGTKRKREDENKEQEEEKSLSTPSNGDKEDASDSEEKELTQAEKAFLKSGRCNKLVSLIKQRKTKEEIMEEMRINKDSFHTYRCMAYRLGKLLKTDTLYLKRNQGVSQLNIVVKCVKEKKPMAEILKDLNVKDPKRVTRIISQGYEKRLESSETEYLKQKKTVIGKNGNTKNKIIAFLQTVYKERIFETKKALYEAFLKSDIWTKGKTRDFTYSTFQGHLKTLKEKNEISQDIVLFIESCTNKTCNANGKRIRHVKIRRGFGT